MTAGWALLAATRAGVVRAAEEGGAWQAELAHPCERCTAVAVAADVAYAGARSGGVARSRDGGRTWEPAGLGGLAVTALAASDEVVLAGSAFGQVGKENLRLSYANSQENLGRALERMRGLLETL